MNAHKPGLAAQGMFMGVLNGYFDATQAKNAPLSLRPLHARGGLMTGAAVGAAAAIPAAAGLSVLFVPPQDCHSCGGEEDENADYKYGSHCIMPSP